MDLATSDKTLLALLLALKDLETPLSENTQNQLYEIGEQLELDPDDWEFIKEGLLDIIAQNSQLNHNFQNNLTKLEAFDQQTIQQFIPTDLEIAQVMPTATIETRGYGSDSLLSLHPNIFIAQKVLKETDSVTVTQNLTWLERVETLLSQSSKGDNNLEM